MRGPDLRSQVTHQARGHVANQKRYISTFIRLGTQNLAGWCLRMRGLHPQCHVTFRHRGHLTNKKRHISTFI